MDFDRAERRIQEAADMPPLSDIIIELLGVVEQLQTRVRISEQRIEYADGVVEQLQERVTALGVKLSDVIDALRAGLRP